MYQALRGTAATERTRGGAERGMSLIEVLIAVAIMATVAVSLLPLFSRSVRQNREGSNYMDFTNIGRSALEEYLQLDFNAPQLTLADGAPELVAEHYWDPVSTSWVLMPADPSTLADTIQWHRIVRVQQFASGDLVEDGTLDFPLSGGTEADRIQLKEVSVLVRPLWKPDWVFGRPTPISLHVLKAV